MIRTVGDQLKANEISLLGETPEKRKAAKKTEGSLTEKWHFYFLINDLSA